MLKTRPGSRQTSGIPMNQVTSQASHSRVGTTADLQPRGASRVYFLLLLRRTRPSGQGSGCSIVGGSRPMGQKPKFRSGRQAYSRPGKRRIYQASWCATRASSTFTTRRVGCSEGEYYATMSAQAACCSKERLHYHQVVRADGSAAEVLVGRPTSGRKFGKLPPEC